MKTSELTGAQLDYWVARAEGIPAEQLSIRRVPRTDWLHVIRDRSVLETTIQMPNVLRYSTDWAQGGPLIEKHADVLYKNGPGWHVRTLLLPITRPDGYPCYGADGDTPLIAICRAVVRAAFGDEVEEVGVCE